MILTVPYPPSANSIWRNVNGRTLKSAAYRGWLAETLVLLRAQRAPKVAGSYRLHLIADRPDKRRRDLGNLLKATEDALVLAGVIEDDHLSTKITLEWSNAPAKKPGSVRLTVEAA